MFAYLVSTSVSALLQKQQVCYPVRVLRPALSVKRQLVRWSPSLDQSRLEWLHYWWSPWFCCRFLGVLVSSQIGGFPLRALEVRLLVCLNSGWRDPCSLPDLRRSAVLGGWLELTFVSVLRFCLDLAWSHLGYRQRHKIWFSPALQSICQGSVSGLYLGIVLAYHACFGHALH